MSEPKPPAPATTDTPTVEEPGVRLVQVDSLRAPDSQSSCLRPLGLCDLGSCDVCWYSPTHPRFARDRDAHGQAGDTQSQSPGEDVPE